MVLFTFRSQLFIEPSMKSYSSILFMTIISFFIKGTNGSEQHLDQSEMSFLRYVLPDYFASVSDEDLEVITAFQTDEKLSFNQQKEGTFKVLEERNIGSEVKKHFTDLYKLEDKKRQRFTNFLNKLSNAVDEYFHIWNQKNVKIGHQKEQISNLVDRLEKPVADALKVAIDNLESSRLLNASRKKSVDEKTRQQLLDLV